MQTKLKELSLFSGAGGGLLASKHLLGWRTIGYVEYNEYCQRVIAQRIKDGYLDEAPIFGDIKAFNREGFAEAYTGLVDVVSGGFPCQDISIAKSKSDGICGERSGLWKEMAKTVRKIRPRFVFVENTSAITFRGLGVVLGDLAKMGYDAMWGCISASMCGASHKRDRLWIVAHSMFERLQRRDIKSKKLKREIKSGSIEKLVQNISWLDVSNPHAFGSNDGLADRVERTKCIGNGQVPIVAATAWNILTEGII